MSIGFDIPTGWIPFDDRTTGQNKAHDVFVSALPKFATVLPRFATPPVGTKVLFTDLWKHPKTIAALGKPYSGIHQITGSCVGAGGGNVLATTQMIEVIMQGQQEKIIIPFWLLTYGMSRYLMGERGQGEGSLGSTFAKAAKTYGVLDAADTRFPQPTDTDGLVWGQNVEMKWSAGGSIDQSLFTESKQHVISECTELHSFEEVRDAILAGKCVSRAFGYFANPGSPKVQQGYLVGKYDGRGGHQESWQGYVNHPDLGEMIYEMNQWGRKVYGEDPAGGAPGGVWILAKDIDRMCKSGDAEIYAYAGMSGWKAANVTKFM